MEKLKEGTMFTSDWVNYPMTVTTLGHAGMVVEIRSSEEVSMNLNTALR